MRCLRQKETDMCPRLMRDFHVILIIVIVETVYSAKNNTVSIVVKSTRCRDSCYLSSNCKKGTRCCKSSVLIEGKEHSSGRNGIDIVAVNKDTGTVTRTKHITRIGRRSATELRRFFRLIPTNEIIIVASQRNCRVKGWYHLIRKYLYGANKDFSPTAFDSVILISCKDRCSADLSGTFAIPSFLKRSDNSRPLRVVFELPLQGKTVISSQVPVTAKRAPSTSLPVRTSTGPVHTLKGPALTSKRPLHTSKGPSSNQTEAGKVPRQGNEKGNGLFSLPVILGIGFCVLLILIVLVVLITLLCRKRGKSHRQRPLCESNPKQDEERYTTLLSHNESPSYEVLVKGNLYEGVRRECPEASKPLQIEDSEEYDTVPVATCSISPSKIALALSEQDDYLNEGDSDNFAAYVQLTKDSNVYKKPSSVPKHDPPKEKPPSLVDQCDVRADDEEHIYEPAIPFSKNVRFGLGPR